jgi:hypothetical protein
MHTTVCPLYQIPSTHFPLTIQRNKLKIEKFANQRPDRASSPLRYMKNMEIIEDEDISTYVHLSRNASADEQGLIARDENWNQQDSKQTILQNGLTREVLGKYTAENNAHITVEGRLFAFIENLHAQTIPDELNGQALTDLKGTVTDTARNKNYKPIPRRMMLTGDKLLDDFITLEQHTSVIQDDYAKNAARNLIASSLRESKQLAAALNWDFERIYTYN